MMTSEQSDQACILARRSFFAAEAVVLSVLLLLAIIALLRESSVRDIFLLMLIYGGFGGLYFLGRLSNLSCPSKVLLVGVTFVSASIGLNALLF